MGYLNKEVRRLKEEGYQFWPMETQADWLKTRRRLASLFSDFALSRNDYIKVWTGYRVTSEHIRMSLTKFGIPTTFRQYLAKGEPYFPEGEYGTLRWLRHKSLALVDQTGGDRPLPRCRQGQACHRPQQYPGGLPPKPVRECGRTLPHLRPLGCSKNCRSHPPPIYLEKSVQSSSRIHHSSLCYLCGKATSSAPSPVR